MARVHVETWKTTYRGIVPDEHLDRLTVESDLRRGFGSWLGAPPPEVAAFVAEAREPGVVGFAVGGPNRDEDVKFTGELGAIYVLMEHQGQGLGRELVSHVARHLLDQGHTSMLCWVLEANTSRGFYERLGGKVVRREVRPAAGTRLPEVAYGWDDLSRLLSR
ncbi:MAG: GNAT family N-acetyltransferase [Euryarchaeota archaeon]|nr:GNAT family N-acetyltransferase [Euryarchaeota archaeon]